MEGMTSRSGFTPDEARAAGERIGIDWGSAPFDLEQFRMGMDVELEHGARDPQTNVTDDDVIRGRRGGHRPAGDGPGEDGRSMTETVNGQAAPERKASFDQLYRELMSEAGERGDPAETWKRVAETVAHGCLC